MNVTINIIEVASELAELRVLEEFNNEEERVYEETEDGTCYTEDAQEIFNYYYDYYFNFITDREIK